MMKTLLRNPLFGILLIGSALPGVGYAKGYHVDVLVFLNSADVVNEQPIPTKLSMVPAQGLVPDKSKKLAVAGVEVVPTQRFGLSQEWDRLNGSVQFQPLLRLAWIQESSSSGTPIRIQAGPTYTLANGKTVDAISGYIALFTGTFLYLDTKVTYTETGPKGTPVSYLVNEIRRVKFNDLQYVDSPKLGILAQVIKVQ